MYSMRFTFDDRLKRFLLIKLTLCFQLADVILNWYSPKLSQGKPAGRPPVVLVVSPLDVNFLFLSRSLCQFPSLQVALAPLQHIPAVAGTTNLPRWHFCISIFFSLSHTTFVSFVIWILLIKVLPVTIACLLKRNC